MEMLIKEMMELAKCVIYLATYWIVRSSLTSASQVTDLIAVKQEQVHVLFFTFSSFSWGLSSLALRLSRLRSCLRMQVDVSQEKIDQILYKKIMELLKVHTKIDNQELFHLFLSFDDDFPLKDSSSESKVGISRLKHKVVMLLISKPDLSPIDQTLLLLHQTHEHPHHKNIEQDYEIVWVPVSSSETWILDEHINFAYLSNTLPWLAIRQPWLLNSAVVRMIKDEW
nr:protein sieve element occlusion C [Tanacetum cinerariifolium]